MTTIDQLFTDIARKHLFIETLEERKSDRLDFHDVSVLTVKDALQAAYDAGAASASVNGTPPELREAASMALATIDALSNDVDTLRSLHGDYPGYDHGEACNNTWEALDKLRAALALDKP